jgi:hypothetical protein
MVVACILSDMPGQELEVEYSSYDETTEEIYQDLCKHRRNNDLPTWVSRLHVLFIFVIAFTLSCSNKLKYTFQPSQLSTAASTHTLEKRDYVIKELVETEKNYIEVLQNLQKYFMKPLTTILTQKEHSTIFCNIKVLK